MANRGHDSVATFAVDPETGRLSTYRIDATDILDPLEVHDLGMWVSWILPVAFP